MLKALGIDEDAIKREEPGVLHDMRRVCALCIEKSRCNRELKAGTATLHHREYCANTYTIDPLEITRSRTRPTSFSADPAAAERERSSLQTEPAPVALAGSTVPYPWTRGPANHGHRRRPAGRRDASMVRRREACVFLRGRIRAMIETVGHHRGGHHGQRHCPDLRRPPGFSVVMADISDAARAAAGWQASAAAWTAWSRRRR